jgi:hypothetical protein
MQKLFSNEKFRFFTKVIIAHVITYVVVTIAAMPLTFDYAESVMELMGFRPLDEINMGAVLVAQFVRGGLLGLVIWWIKDSIIGKKFGWLKLWAILAILGIFNTYGPSHGSIQGMIYLAPIEDLPISASLGMLETLAQPLLFSIAVTFQRKKQVTTIE